MFGTSVLGTGPVRREGVRGARRLGSCLLVAGLLSALGGSTAAYCCGLPAGGLSHGGLSGCDICGRTLFVRVVHARVLVLCRVPGDNAARRLLRLGLPDPGAGRLRRPAA